MKSIHYVISFVIVLTCLYPKYGFTMVYIMKQYCFLFYLLNCILYYAISIDIFVSLKGRLGIWFYRRWTCLFLHCESEYDIDLCGNRRTVPVDFRLCTDLLVATRELIDSFALLNGSVEVELENFEPKKPVKMRWQHLNSTFISTTKQMFSWIQLMH